MLLLQIRNAVKRQKFLRAASSQASPYEGVPENALNKKPTGDVKRSKLENGLQVISVENYSPASRVTLIAKAGLRTEGYLPNGTSSVLARLAFQSTEKSTAFRRTVEIEQLCGSFKAESTREAVQYTADLPRANVENFLAGPLLETLSPAVHEYEVREATQLVQSDISNSTVVDALFDALHREAYDDKTLGRSKLNFGSVKDADVQAFLANQFDASNLALVGVGVDHAQFTELARRTLGAAPASSARLAEVGVSAIGASGTSSEYVGGRIRVPRAGQSLFAIGFNTKGVNPAAVSVAAFLLGKTPFGEQAVPGSGATGLLAAHTIGGVAGLSSFKFTYSDGGLFGVFGDQALQAEAVTALKGLQKATAAQVKAAAQQAAAAAADWATTRVGQGNLLSYSALGGLGAFNNLFEVSSSLSNVSHADFSAALKQLLSSPPTIASVGDVSNTLRSF